MILYYLVASTLLAFCLYLYKETMKKWLFANFHGWFFNHREFSKWYGIRFERSDDWRTNRTESHVTGFEFPLFKLIGIVVQVGKIDFDKIKELKQRLSDKSDQEFNFAPYFKKGESYNWDQFEIKISDVFFAEIFRLFDVKPPQDKKRFIAAILILRRALSTGGLYGKWLMAKSVGTLYPLAQYFKSLTYAEQMIALAPFMTVLDFCMFNLRDKARNLEICERLQILSNYFDLKYIPMLNNGEMVFCEVFVNENNNFANSMFGPKGVQCPGGVLVKMVLDGFVKFMDVVEYDVKKVVRKGGKEDVIFTF